MSNKHILVPKGFQGKQLMRANKGINHDAGDTPSDGECMSCRGTGAIPHRVWLEDFDVRDGKIITATVKMAWEKCRCYLSARWIRFHPANVQTILIPKWERELNEMKEREKESILRACGGNYVAGTDTFLRDIGYKPPSKDKKILSLDEIVHKSMQKKGDIPS